MAKAEKEWASIGAAECARRTGLTVRALRVYEHHGLIEPRRTGKGWRCYGPRELQRLNVIVTLKAFGMTLAQIRTLLKTKTPPLTRVLQIQLQACRAKKDAVEKALALVRAALATIGSGKPFSLEDLCNLTRSMDMEAEMDGVSNFAIVRGLINERITPEEERAHMNWVASLQPEQLKTVLVARKALRAALRALQDLYEKKLDPAAPEVQTLIVQLKDVGFRYGIFKGQAAMFEWNPSITRKYLEVGARAAWAGMDDDFVAYVRAANAAAPWSQPLRQVTDEATKLVEQKAEPSSAAGQALARHLALICSDHSLGDPLFYARWAPYSPFRESAGERAHARLTSVWAFLESAFEAAAPATR
ncbi:MAG TPA: MerR family transcriptional regulator [Steroidobacteraceae bacterium]|jgi:DNA-binding transcriptional MerR regulator